MELEVNTT